MLWDVGIEVGHSVRTIAECESEMAADITIRTSLLEHRLITGSRALLRATSARMLAARDGRARRSTRRSCSSSSSGT